MRRPAIISFDAGNTLIFPRRSVGQLYAEALHERNLPVDAQLIETRFGPAFQEATAARTSERTDEDAERAFWHQVVNVCLRDLCPNEAIFESVFADLFELFRSADAWKTEPGTGDALDELKAAGFRLVVLSNADGRFRNVLEDMGLESRFEHLFISGEIGWEKPSRRAFGIVEETLSAGPEQFLHVGDSIYHDIDGAEQAGWQSMLLDPAHRHVGTHHGPSIKHLSELVKLLS